MSNSGAPFFDCTNVFEGEFFKRAHNKLIFILLKFIADEGRAVSNEMKSYNRMTTFCYHPSISPEGDLLGNYTFSLAFRLLNMDINICTC